MNDRYLYRAKRCDTGEWVEGFYFCMEHTDCRHTHHFIMPLGTDLSLGTPIEKIQVEVDPSTICQCTGLKDKNGKMIWENDIVETIYDGKQNHNYVVIWDKDDLGFLATNGKEHYETHCEYLGCCEEIIVIGNIFNNPELLEVGE